MERRAGAEPGWAVPLAERHGVKLAMIYDDWFGDLIGADWVRLGTLQLEGRFRYAAKPQVAFYATTPEAVPELLTKLEAWTADLPEGAVFLGETEGAK